MKVWLSVKKKRIAGIVEDAYRTVAIKRLLTKLDGAD